nr:DNA/RNA helicase, DEAD/DEAH box type, N-terminal [Tanacetum cinerariifolium]
MVYDTAGSVQIWPGLAGSGRGLAGYSRGSWPGLAGNDRLWLGVAVYGGSWLVMAGFGRLWPGLGRLWPGAKRVEGSFKVPRPKVSTMMTCIDEDVEKSSQTHQDDVGSGVSSSGQNITESTVIQVEAKSLIQSNH